MERTVTAVPVLAAVKAAAQMGTGGTEGVDSGSPVAVGVAAGAAGRVARGVRNRNDASVESIEGGDNWRVETKGVEEPERVESRSATGHSRRGNSRGVGGGIDRVRRW